MSGGGAGKVYFVLYLAVVLELLIIIVERDEAEEHLHQKQKETMRIVESILSQLQAGAGSEGINTRPQDEITIPQEGMLNTKEKFGFEIKPDRKYLIEVGVTDISSEIARKEGENDKDYYERIKKLILLGNVAELEYQIFFNPSEDPYNAPEFPTEDYINSNHIDFATFQPGQEFTDDQGNTWQFRGLQRLVLDDSKVFDRMKDYNNLTLKDFQPIYPDNEKVIVGPTFAPDGVSPDSVFYYSTEDTKTKTSKGKSEIQKRVFVVRFQPDKSQGGWYRLRFSSRTNKILGVSKNVNPKAIEDETKVNIGTVQLSVKDLRKVQKTLFTKLEKYSLPEADMLLDPKNYNAFMDRIDKAKEKAVAEETTDQQTILSNINLYSYIAQLLAPGMSRNFTQNKGSIDFNIRVVKPNIQQVNPQIVANDVNAFDKLPPSMLFDIVPYKGDNKVTGVVLQNDVEVAQMECMPYAKYRGEDVVPSDAEQTVKFVGIVSRPLAAGQYTIRITHQLGSKSAVKDVNLTVHEAKLTDQSMQRNEGMIQYRSYYGDEIFLSAVPITEDIPANQYSICLKTDKYLLNDQQECVNGLNIDRGNGLKLNSNADSVYGIIKWTDPITKKDIIFMKTAAKIEQMPPRIGVNAARAANYNFGSYDEGTIVVSGIIVFSSKESYDKDQYADLNINVSGEGTLIGKTRSNSYNYKITSVTARTEYKKGDKSANYTVIARVQLNPNEKISKKDERNPISLSGELDMVISGQCKNTINGKVSKKMTKSKAISLSTTLQPSRKR